MIKILIVTHAMEIGGAEKALLGLLETIDTTKYQVDLFLLRHQGELMKEIPDSINLLPEISEYADLAVPITTVLKKHHFKIAYARYRAKVAAKRRVKKLRLGKNDVAHEYSHKYTVKHMPVINKTEYDLAISFLTPHYFVSEKVNALKKIAWIHTDYSAVSVDVESQVSMWNRYDYIVSISENAAESFVSVFPKLQNSVNVIQNILPTDYINRIANDFDVSNEFSDDAINVLSIGRFGEAKNFDNIPEICKMICDSGLNIRWYLIGYGAGESLIRTKIQEYCMENHVIILGKKANPYPYIKACDVYIQPSRFEGKCVSVSEAQFFCKPVIITNYPTSHSQLKDGFDGVIVPLDNAGCAQGIFDVLSNPKLMSCISENCKLGDYSNKVEILKLYSLIG